MSRATVNLPTSCSRCAMRSAEASDCLSAGSKRLAAFSRSCHFHFESCSSLRLCRRHTSAWELSPLRASRTTLALNSGVKFLRLRLVLHRILLSSRWILYHNLVLESGPNFRWQYSNFPFPAFSLKFFIVKQQKPRTSRLQNGILPLIVV